MNAPESLEKIRQQLIKKLLDKKKDIERQLAQLGYHEKSGVA